MVKVHATAIVKEKGGEKEPTRDRWEDKGKINAPDKGAATSQGKRKATGTGEGKEKVAMKEYAQYCWYHKGLVERYCSKSLKVHSQTAQNYPVCTHPSPDALQHQLLDILRAFRNPLLVVPNVVRVQIPHVVQRRFGLAEV